MFLGSISSNMIFSQSFDGFKHQNPRWPPRWPLDMAKPCNFTNNCLIDAKLVSRPIFSGPRSSNMILSQSFGGLKHGNARWLQRWPQGWLRKWQLDMENLCKFTNYCPIYANLVPRPMFSESRSSNMTLSQSFDGFKHQNPKWPPRWPPSWP